MFGFFKKNKNKKDNIVIDFDIELNASILAYEVARLDGEISNLELDVLLDEIKKIANKVGKSEEDILLIVQKYSENSVSFYEFIRDINNNYSKKDKLSLIQFLYDVAYADKVLEVVEERLIRRIADLIKIKDLEVLKIKDISKDKGQ